MFSDFVVLFLAFRVRLCRCVVVCQVYTCACVVVIFDVCCSSCFVAVYDCSFLSHLFVIVSVSDVVAVLVAVFASFKHEAQRIHNWLSRLSSPYV